MFPTVEVRWFDQGPIPPEVVAWFQRDRPEVEEQPPRVDYYLRLLDTDALGIKLREGKIEAKRRDRQYGGLRLHPRVTGKVEGWTKWSFELAQSHQTLTEGLAPTAAWVGVRKERRLCRYRLAGEEIRPIAPETHAELGCDLELTRVRAQGQAWWTLGFEAFGEPALLRETLLAVAGKVLATHEPPSLAAEDSRSYPQWLAALAQRS